jgi:crotonobetainyl-CoA:carnitine CoA-transferase CaiB-like acyl-CoA transferase
LDGLKVVEIGVAMAGPFCGMTLADYGADVVKVERVGHGDESRHWPPYFKGDVSYYFAAANRNKRSFAVDLKTPEGLDLVRRLALDADILIDNFRVGALDALGLGYEALSQVNPRLIYCSISGFGPEGPRRGERANDIFMQAFTGGMSVTGYPDGPPAKMGMSVADVGAGMFGVIGILLAIETRHRTGRGQRVDTSLMEGQLSMLAYHLTYYFATGQAPQRKGASGQVSVPYQAFKASDEWVVIAAFTNRMWQGACRAFERPEWIEDPRFLTADERIHHRDLLVQMIRDIVSTQPAAHWMERLAAEGVPCTPVNTIDKVVTDPQVKARNMITEVSHPEAGMMRMAGPPIKLGAHPPRPMSAPPLLGQHTKEILSQLGLDETTIQRLMADNVVGLAGGVRTKEH